MKHSIIIVDSESNLIASTKVIPEGVIVKVQGSDKFKVGDGYKTWNDLKFVGSDLKLQVNGNDVQEEITKLNFADLKVAVNEGIATVRPITIADGGWVDTPATAYSKTFDGGTL